MKEGEFASKRGPRCFVVKPDIISYNTVLCLNCKICKYTFHLLAIWTAERCGDSETALSLLREMHSERCKPNTLCYNGGKNCFFSFLKNPHLILRYDTSDSINFSSLVQNLLIIVMTALEKWEI